MLIPATICRPARPYVQFGIDGSLAGWPVLVFALGLITVTILDALKVKVAILVPDQVADVPDFSLLGEFSLLGSWEAVGIITVVLLVFTLLLADFFDTMGTMVAVGAEGRLMDENGNPPNTQRILIVDSIGAAARLTICASAS